MISDRKIIMQIPFFDLSKQNNGIKKDIDIAISRVINRGVFILGPEVVEFEKKFAEFTGTKYAVGVASGTDAIILSLLSLGIGDGSEVILPANSYPTAFAVAATGAKIKLVDIDPYTYTLDPGKLMLAVSEKTKAIIPVHLYGQPADMERIIEIGKEYSIPIIEDCAQATGSSIKYQESSIKYKKETKNQKSILNTKYLILDTNKHQAKKNIIEQEESKEVWKKTGSWGDIGCFSFYPTKNLGAFGDGGMVVTNNEEIYKKIRLLRMYGEIGRYNSIILGRNSRLDEIQAAILHTKLKHVDKWNTQRRKIASLYCRAMAGLDSIQLPAEFPFAKHVYHLYVIRTKKRDLLKEYLSKKGIGTGVHYPVSVHLVYSFRYLGYKAGDFPEAEKASGDILSLPMYPELGMSDISEITSEINSFFSQQYDNQTHTK